MHYLEAPWKYKFFQTKSKDEMSNYINFILQKAGEKIKMDILTVVINASTKF